MTSPPGGGWLAARRIETDVLRRLTKSERKTFFDALSSIETNLDSVLGKL
jgi:hypothetical protein